MNKTIIIITIFNYKKIIIIYIKINQCQILKEIVKLQKNIRLELLKLNLMRKQEKMKYLIKSLIKIKITIIIEKKNQENESIK